MKTAARLIFLLTTALQGSFYAVTKEILGRIDPVALTFLEVLVLAPVALALVVLYWNDLDKIVLKRGILLGSWLCLAMLTMSVSLKFTSATDTAFFPSIGGVMGACITCLVLKRALKREDWIAGGLSLIGVLIILIRSGGDIELRGNLIALLGALFFTVYIFLVDHDRKYYGKHQKEEIFWLILGVEQLTLVFWMTLIALLFGDWQHVHLNFPRDAEIIVYIGLGTTFVPFALSIFMQKYVPPLEVAFLSILEPVWGVAIAYAYLGEKVSFPVYMGGVFVIAGAVFHTWSTSRRRQRLPIGGQRTTSLLLSLTPVHLRIGNIVYPMFLLSGGVLLLNGLGGSIPTVISSLSTVGPGVQFYIDHGQMLPAVLLCLHVLLWLIAWGALLTIGLLTAISTARTLLLIPEERTASIAASNKQAAQGRWPTRPVERWQ